MKNIIAVLLLVVCSLGCMSVTMTEPYACKRSTLSFTKAAPIAGLPSVNTASTTVDFSDTISKLNSIGDIKFAIASNVLTGRDFAWVSHITIDVMSTNDQSTYPTKHLSDQDIMSNDGTINLITLMNSEDLYSYFSQGEVTLSITLYGTVPNENMDVVNDLCTTETLSLNKHL